MDVLIAGPFILRKQDQDPAIIDKVRARRKFQPD
jgi:hypothetical protein